MGESQQHCVNVDQVTGKFIQDNSTFINFQNSFVYTYRTLKIKIRESNKMFRTRVTMVRDGDGGRGFKGTGNVIS